MVVAERLPVQENQRRFHSINFPSEWGGKIQLYCFFVSKYEVSIQLISPASGEVKGLIPLQDLRLIVSIQLISPASGETNSNLEKIRWDVKALFPLINFPSEWGVENTSTD